MIKKSLQDISKDPLTPKTQLVMVVGFLAIAWFLELAWLRDGALALGLLFLLLPPLGNAIVWAWYRLAFLMSLVVNPVVLGAVYWVFITPIALLFRLVGNDPLQKKRAGDTTYSTREKTYSPRDLKYPW
jgi:hypothetical protein